ncbi:uncharacterized protein N7483_007562 [Penicillium malachiteum]|uniref:uncharacterized protein n=1 Tax=Penicillium malachiteum TaxID=1324776 RepID=UPI002547576F|nr:uncharacterized protein N7483_007562 [Penicillium malachiteum]KAJ5726205.1 hypothetical protein N7483_007562 [Penicillium malachiteum]
MNHTVGVRPPPPGVSPDFHSQPWLLSANRIAVGVGSTLSTLLLIMRIYTKACIMGKFWWDDDGYAHSSFAIHIWDIPLSDLVAYRKTVLALAVIYLPALAFAKLAVLMLYYRLLQSVPVWRYILYSIAAAISTYSTALVFALIFACHPIPAGWSLSNPSACIHRTGLHLGTAIANTASDVVLIMIPIKVMWGMHLPLLQKIGALIIFGIGCLFSH